MLKRNSGNDSEHYAEDIPPSWSDALYGWSFRRDASGDQDSALGLPRVSQPLLQQMTRKIKTGQVMAMLRRSEYPHSAEDAASISSKRTAAEAQARRDLERARRASCRKEREYYAMKARCGHLHSRMCAAVTAPVRKLPVELLRLVLAYAIIEEDDAEVQMRTRIGVACVSRHWRTVALDARTLWTGIACTDTYPRLAHRTRVIAMCMARAHGLPLHMEVHHPDGERTPVDWDLLVHAFAEARTLILEVPEGPSTEGLNLELDRAVSVMMHGCGGWLQEAPHRVYAPALTNFDVAYMGGMEDFELLPWHQLTRLRFVEHVADIASALPVLAICQQLVVLRFFCRDLGIPLPRDTVTLPRLTELELGVGAAILLSGLSVPALRTLAVSVCDRGDKSAIRDFFVQRRQGRRLRNLLLEKCETVDPQYLREIFTSTPMLVDLHLEGVASAKHRRRSRGLVRASLLREVVWTQARQSLPKLTILALVDEDARKWPDEAEAALKEIIDSRCGDAGAGCCSCKLEEIYIVTPDAECSRVIYEAKSRVLERGVAFANWEPGRVREEESRRQRPMAIQEDYVIDLGDCVCIGL
ncbi:hypothetical protein HDZ31DRAFT_36926 [Schizophyllum fasciatum]